jgi:hypothetical protein
VSCSTSNAVIIADCQSFINAHINDGSLVVGVTNRQAILTVGGCSIVQKFGGSETEQTTAAVIASHANLIMAICNAGNSNVMEGDAHVNDKFCRTKPSSQVIFFLVF